MTDTRTGPVRFIDPINVPEDGRYPGFRPGTVRENGLRIDHDVKVVLRGGESLYVDVYRSADVPGPLPVLIAWGPYGKHNSPGRDKTFLPAAEIDPAWGISRYAPTEAPDPMYWCPHGYAVVFADPRGTWGTPGQFTMGTQQEAEDYHDLIEWAGTRDWSTGKVGLAGASYLAFAQWRVAATRPPHLAAINPWEGLLDFYREIFYHGGIPETRFIPLWTGKAMGWAHTGTAVIEALQSLAAHHPLRDEYWHSKEVNLTGVDVPAFVVAGLANHGLHLRGTLEAYKQLAGGQTWLEVHGQKIWKHYYDPDSVARQRQFFDWALKDEQNGWVDQPPVRIEVRDHGPEGTLRAEHEWPPERTRYTPLYLDASTASLTTTQPDTPASMRYNTAATKPGRAQFDVVFTQDTELTGHMKLRLWIEVDASTDADLFVAIQKIDVNAQVIGFPFVAFRDDGPVALGWLRASHRALDEQRSTPQQPWHPHTAEEPLEPGVPVPVDIELWPSATHFGPGEGLRVVVQGSDVYLVPGGEFGHENTRNAGHHTLHTGGRYDSHLLVPMITGAPA
ncbi:CocE/NonD family hydrolase [Kibdelosporangium phytohabitans]|uniref:Xaa-Pro dipeptidyl-peptidase C-terminal domain-containing protein n=1 Tax=Kibdelosporangium phytohabitans TaxID=860235 RepID=A0A0N7F444_9PSEU|nr:CocE/NonD family hydrolase [Kibdelosporangium phytohabitans]ALG10399.1 hypothetical protein AOZ06_29040 [Kibdelosporangium phytohabitans]MBE1461460.1 putative acyl esterase [Kibdelosporangium phytohabitans]